MARTIKTLLHSANHTAQRQLGFSKKQHQFQRLSFQLTDDSNPEEWSTQSDTVQWERYPGCFTQSFFRLHPMANSRELELATSDENEWVPRPSWAMDPSEICRLVIKQQPFWTDQDAMHFGHKHALRCSFMNLTHGLGKI